MSDVAEQTQRTAWPRVLARSRRGPVLRPSTSSPGLFGLDLTAGCLHGCAYCHLRGSRTDPGPDRVVFDPETAQKLDDALDEWGSEVRRVVLSPWSDPLPPDRSIRAEAIRVVDTLLNRGIPIYLMTRGRLPRLFVERLALQPDLAVVGLGLISLNKPLVRALEPRAASPGGRLRDLARLSAAGIEVEARLEPMIPGLTDTRENILPLFQALARAGVGRVLTHYLYLQPGMSASLSEALVPFGWSERWRDDFANGPVFPIGSVGSTKHYPRDVRQESLARLIAWGAECGLLVATGSSQNPDLPQIPSRRPPTPQPAPARELATVGTSETARAKIFA